MSCALSSFLALSVSGAVNVHCVRSQRQGLPPPSGWLACPVEWWFCNVPWCPTPRGICVALTPWKQLRVALSTEHRARLSPTTAGICKRQGAPCQPLEVEKTVHTDTNMPAGWCSSHGVTRIECRRLDELSQSKQTRNVQGLCNVWIEATDEHVGRSGAGRRKERKKKVWQSRQYRASFHCFLGSQSNYFNTSSLSFLPLFTYELRKWYCIKSSE